MLREREQLLLQVHKLLDTCLTAAAFGLAYFIKLYVLPQPYGGLTPAPNYMLVLLMIIICWYLALDLFGVYAPYRRRTYGDVFWSVVKAACAAMVAVIGWMYLLKITDVSRIMMGIFFVLNIALLTTSKGILYTTITHYRRRGYNYRYILVVGSRERAKDVIEATASESAAGFRILGCLEIDQSDIGKEVKNGIRVLGTVEQLEEILKERVVDELVFAMPLRDIQDADRHIAVAEELGVSVRIIPDWQIQRLTYQPRVASIQFEEFLGLPTMALHTTPRNRHDLLIKSGLDYAFAGIVFVLSLPLMLFFAAAIKISSRGPVLFTQERCGLNGRRFTVYKFRTMVADAEARRKQLKALDEADGPVFKIRKDPRIIPYVGTLMRKTALDELPQVINVLKGEMSIVGPRPPIPAEVEEYDLWQRRRLSMKPGLTCLWQITPNRNDTSFEEWMKMDLRYIDNWSLGLDFKILLRTTKTVLTGVGR